jgi:phage gpG-like protein
VIFRFSKLEFPPIPNRVEGAKYERFKRTLVALMLTQRLEVFAQEASASGPWPPLSVEAFRRRIYRVNGKKRKRAHAVKMLQDTGVLRQSFTSDTGPGNSMRVEEVGADYALIASNVEYARIHNQGGTIAWPGTSDGFGRGIVIPAHAITIPARPFDQFTAENAAEIAELTELYLNGQLPAQR